MFSGLVASVGTVVSTKGDASVGMHFKISCNLSEKHLELGASIACNGVCLTVTNIESSKDGHAFWVDVSPESLRVTTLGKLFVGSKLNLEPSLRVGDAVGGHWVSGHVDGVGWVKDLTPKGDGHVVWRFTPPRKLMGFIAERGSVTVDGTSLTVIGVDDHHFMVNLIPHTAENTCFGQISVGDEVNIEVDILARYLVRWQEFQDNRE